MIEPYLYSLITYRLDRDQFAEVDSVSAIDEHTDYIQNSNSLCDAHNYSDMFFGIVRKVWLYQIDTLRTMFLSD